MVLRAAEVSVLSVHVAIVKGEYVERILRGEKVVECRLTKRGGGAFGKVSEGDRIYFKKSGGAFFGKARIGWVWESHDEEGVDVEGIRREFGAGICAGAGFWEGAVGMKYAQVMGFGEVVEVKEGPRFERRFMGAWYVLGDEAEAGLVDEEGYFEVVMTAGGIRNLYVSLGKEVRRFEGEGEIELMLRGGEVVKTDIVGGRFRWRGWGKWKVWCGLRVGDRLVFRRVGRGVWGVAPVES